MSLAQLKLALRIYSQNFPSFLDDVRDALPDGQRDNKSVRPLAIELGASDSQVREWVITRRYVPSGPIAFKMLLWLLNRPKISPKKARL